MRMHFFAWIVTLALVSQSAFAEVDCAVKAGLYIRAMANRQFASNKKDQLVPFRITKSVLADADAYYKNQSVTADQIQKLKAAEVIYNVTAVSADEFPCTYYAFADRVKLETKKECVLRSNKLDQCLKKLK